MNAKKLVKEYERQLGKEPDNLVLRLKLAAALRELGRNADALAMYRTVALTYKGQGRLAQAIAVCRSVVEMEPSHREMQELLFQLDALRIAREAAGGEGMTGIPAPLPPPPETAPHDRLTTPHEKLPPLPPVPMLPEHPAPAGRPSREPPRATPPPATRPQPTQAGERPRRTTDPMVTIPGVRRPVPPSVATMPPTIPPMDPVTDPELERAQAQAPADDDDEGMTIPVWSPKLANRIPLPPVAPPPVVAAPPPPIVEPIDHAEDDTTSRGAEPVAPAPALPADLARFSRGGRLLEPLPSASEADRAGDAERTVFDPHAVERAVAGEGSEAQAGDPHLDGGATDPGRGIIVPEDDDTPLPRPRPLSESTTFALPPGRRGVGASVSPSPLAGGDRTEPTTRMEEEDLGLSRSFGPAMANLAPDGSTPEPPLGPFHRLPPEALRELERRVSIRRVSAGTVIVREGDPGQACYVVQSGAVRVLKRDPSHPDAEQIEVARLGAGALFGEFALLADRRRHATVQAIEPTELYEIPRRAVRELAATYPGVGPELERMYRERLVSTLLATAPIFRPLPDDERLALMSRFDARKFEAGAQIIREGEHGGGLYLVVLGSVEITRRAETTVRERAVLLATLGEGAYFGEMSLLRGTVASASVTAAGPVEVAHLPPRDFYAVVSEYPVLWDELRKEAQRRELANQNILSGDTHVV